MCLGSSCCFSQSRRPSGPVRTARTTTLRSEQSVSFSWKFPFSVKRDGCAQVHKNAREDTRHTLKDLDPQIVFETENCRAESQPRRQLAHRLRGWTPHPVGPDRRQSNCLALFRLDDLSLGFLRDLLRAPRRRAAFAVARPRAARHVAPLAMHRRRYRGIRLGQRRNPNRRQCQRQHSACPTMEEPDHRP